MTYLWSDYTFRRCRKCGRMGYCHGKDALCRDCQLKAMGR